MKRTTLRAAAALLAALALPASAKTYYVDAATGNDANTGLSQTAAFKTIQRAIDKAAAGSTILVAPGNYAPIVSKNKKLSVKSVGGANETAIDGYGSADTGAELGTYGTKRRWGSTVKAYNGGANTKLFGLRISGFGTAVRGGVLTECVVSGNVNSYESGEDDWEYVEDDEKNRIVHRSKLVDCRVESNQASCIVGGSSVTRCEIANNASEGWGGLIQAGTVICSLVVSNVASASTLAECQIYNSTVVFNTVGDDDFEEFAAVDRCNVYGSVVWGNRKEGGATANVCLAYDESTGRSVARDFEKYSREWEDAKQAHSVGGHFTMMHSLTDRPISQTDTKREYYYTNPPRWNIRFYETYKTSKNNITGDPLFIDPAHGDYHLALNSPCKDAGADYTKKTGKFDLDSGARKVGKVDMGAYELQPQTAVPADYDGDGFTDAAFYFAASGQWWIFQSGDGKIRTISLPDRNAVPCPADYDEEAGAEPAYFTASAKAPAFVRVSLDGEVLERTAFGAKGAAPVAAKLHGAKATFGVYTANAKKPAFSFPDGPTIPFGAKASRPVVADFDGDGTDDLGVYTAAASKPAFSILQSSKFFATGSPFLGGPLALGAKGAIPCVADYDGDGRADFATYLSNAKAPYFTRLLSSRKFRETWILPMGNKGDAPVPGVYETAFGPAIPAVWTGTQWMVLTSDWTDADLLGNFQRTHSVSKMVGTTSSSMTNYNFLLAPNLVPGSVIIRIGDTPSFVDNGDHQLVPSGVNGTGSVNYTSGTAQIHFNSSPPDGADIVAVYQYTE